MGFEIIRSKERRNDPCACESGLKYKKCHGDSAKLAVVKHIANEAMLIMIAYEKWQNPNITFDRDDYEEAINNPDFIWPQFMKQFLS
ncbi:MAG: SEC-C domain-containing protein [Deltaproteobacteria bacterium]|nr:SEC-C domain-containing protein [Deltaproteobacteria bacterium]